MCTLKSTYNSVLSFVANRPAILCTPMPKLFFQVLLWWYKKAIKEALMKPAKKVMRASHFRLISVSVVAVLMNLSHEHCHCASGSTFTDMITHSQMSTWQNSGWAEHICVHIIVTVHTRIQWEGRPAGCSLHNTLPILVVILCYLLWIPTMMRKYRKVPNKHVS